MKLTSRQQRVLHLMGDGWELGFYSGYNASAVLQKGGIGKGGPVETVHLGTFFGLFRKDLIQLKKEGFPASIYHIKPTLAPRRGIAE